MLQHIKKREELKFLLRVVKRFLFNANYLSVSGNEQKSADKRNTFQLTKAKRAWSGSVFI